MDFVKIILLSGILNAGSSLCTPKDHYEQSLSMVDRVLGKCDGAKIDELKKICESIGEFTHAEQPKTKDVQRGVIKYLQDVEGSLDSYKHPGKVWDFHELCRNKVLIPCLDFCRPLDPELEELSSMGYDLRKSSTAREAAPQVQDLMAKWRTCDVMFSTRKFCDLTHELYWKGKHEKKDPMDFIKNLFEKRGIKTEIPVGDGQ